MEKEIKLQRFRKSDDIDCELVKQCIDLLKENKANPLGYIKEEYNHSPGVVEVFVLGNDEFTGKQVYHFANSFNSAEMSLRQCFPGNILRTLHEVLIAEL